MFFNLTLFASVAVNLCVHRYMLDHQLACDIEFAVGRCGDIIRAHKYMLVSRSPVFYAMFYGGLGTVHHDAPIVIPDTTAEAFSSMLQLVHLCILYVHCS